MSEQRVIELEIKAAYQEDLLQALNAVVAEQQQIVRLEQAYKHLNERINSLPIDKSDDVSEPPPPHY